MSRPFYLHSFRPIHDLGRIKPHINFNLTHVQLTQLTNCQPNFAIFGSLNFKQQQFWPHIGSRFFMSLSYQYHTGIM
jgi:hypothetical protein